MIGSSIEICPDCKHSLVNNEHGFDQNDGYMDGDKLIHYGVCTYCKVCQRISDNPDPRPADGG